MSLSASAVRSEAINLNLLLRLLKACNKRELLLQYGRKTSYVRFAFRTKFRSYNANSLINPSLLFSCDPFDSAPALLKAGFSLPRSRAAKRESAGSNWVLWEGENTSGNDFKAHPLRGVTLLHLPFGQLFAPGISKTLVAVWVNWMGRWIMNRVIFGLHSHVRRSTRLCAEKRF